MKFNASELNTLFNNYYCKVRNYCFWNDPDFTYQELVIGCTAYYWHVLPDGILDTDDLLDAEESWMKCIAHLTKPMVCDKEWDKVLIDRSHLQPPNLEFDDKGMPIFWYMKDEFKDIYENELNEKKMREQQIEAEWIARREKQKIYQRKRRAKIKEEKNNGK